MNLFEELADRIKDNIHISKDVKEQEFDSIVQNFIRQAVEEKIARCPKHPGDFIFCKKAV